MNENFESNISTNDDQDEQTNTIKKEDKIGNISIINQITEILNNYKKNKQKEEIACQEISQFLKENNIDLAEIKDTDNSTIIQKYCYSREDYYLNCMLLCMDKLLEGNAITQYLLNEDATKMNIFEMCSEAGDLKLFRLLKKYLKNNQDILNHLIDYTDGKNNIFHIAADNNKSISLLFFFSFYHDNNSCLNIKNKSSWTPLHIACYRGNYEFVQYLINLGADMECKDNDNKTPLFYAAQSQNIKTVKYLILSGANKKVKDNKNKTVIEYTRDKNIYNILENKNIFRVACKCETNYQSLKKHYRNIFMIILLIFMIIFHLFIILKYKISNFATKCYNKISFSFEIFLLIFNIILEILVLCIYYFFQVIKKKKLNNSLEKNNNNYNFCLKENGIEYYEMFKYNENICVKCRRVKEMNTQHCIACDVCIDNFDHHCFFLNCCIYSQNKKYFRIFLAVGLITVFFNLMTSFLFFIDFMKYPNIYYGLIYNSKDFNTNIIFDFLIYILNILYFILALFFILGTIIPFMFDFISKKMSSKKKNNNNSNNSNKPNSPLLPINGTQV